jgi:hypothetical protein
MGNSLGRNRVVTIHIPQQQQRLQQPFAAGDVVQGIVKIDAKNLQQLGKLTESLMLHLVGTEQTCCQYHNDHQNTTSVYGKEVVLQESMPLKPEMDAKQQELTFSIRIPDQAKSSFYFQPNPKARPSCSLKVSTGRLV